MEPLPFRGTPRVSDESSNRPDSFRSHNDVSNLIVAVQSS
jgi:hypothetical protein